MKLFERFEIVGVELLEGLPGPAGVLEDRDAVCIRADREVRGDLLERRLVDRADDAFRAGFVFPDRRILDRRTHGIGQEAHREDGDDEDREYGHPESGTAVIQNGPDARLHADLSEGDGTGRDVPPRHAAREERFGVIRTLTGRVALHDALIAGQFHVAAEEDESDPQDRVEPVDGEEQERRGLDPVIPPCDVRLLVREDEGKIPVTQGEGDIDAGADDPEHERRIRPVGEKDVSVEKNGFPHPAPEHARADGGIEKHDRDPEDPHRRRGRTPDLERIRAVFRRRREGSHDGLRGNVDHRDPGGQGRRIAQKDLRRDNLGGREQAQHALEREGQHEPDPDQSPQDGKQPLRRFLHEKSARQKHDERQDPRGDAHVEHAQEDVSHAWPPSGSGRSSPALRRCRPRRDPFSS